MIRKPHNRLPLAVQQKLTRLKPNGSAHLWEGETLWVLARTQVGFVCTRICSTVDWEPLVEVHHYPLLKRHAISE